VYIGGTLQTTGGRQPQSAPYVFNFNKAANVTLSDIVIVNYPTPEQGDNSFDASGITTSFFLFDVDIFDNNEALFSCRDIVSACVDEDNPRLQELLEVSGGSVASFEYGINNAIPHSKGGELLCPGNTINEGFVSLTVKTSAFGLPPDNLAQFVFGFIGLNNGNGRGSMDTWWYAILEIPFPTNP